jgi:hypothetical protein
MRTTMLFAMCVLVGACFHDASSPKSAPQDTTTSCATTVATMIPAAQAADPKHNDWDAETASNLRAVLTNRCEEDRWTPDARACLSNAKAEAQLRACWEKELTGSQREKAERVASAVERAGRGGRAHDEPPAPDAPPPDVVANTGFDLYVTPAGVASWSLDGATRTERLPARVRNIAPGPHLLTIDAPPGFENVSKTILVEAGKAFELRIDLPLDKHDTKLRVTNIDPDKGDVDGGTYVKIIGSAFTCGGACARNATVYFGSRKGTVVRLVSDGEIIVQAPNGKPGETVDVLVRFEPGGELKIPKAFTFVEKN